MLPPGLTHRPAVPSDVPALHALIESAYRGESARAGWTHEADLLEGARTSADALAAIVAHPDERLLLFHRDDALVGCVQLTRRPDNAAYLGLLAVDPRRQADGVGKAILAAAEAEAARHFAARALELTVVSRRPELIAYYERRGYALTGRTLPFPVEVTPPLTLVQMRKRLDGSVTDAR